MPRPPRVDKADLVYHVTNRANARQQIFSTPGDYKAFEVIIREAWERTGMRIYTYTVMPNHWHFAVSPRGDGDLGVFVRWLTLTHTQRYRAFTKSVGSGHLYQGRYKSFLVSADKYFLALCRYIERNALRARLVQNAENWPIEEPANYLDMVNKQEEQEIAEQIRISSRRGTPFGREDWVYKVAMQLGLENTLRSRGRPQKGT